MFCTYCGQILVDGTKFCIKCGKMLTESEVPGRNTSFTSIPTQNLEIGRASKNSTIGIFFLLIVILHIIFQVISIINSYILYLLDLGSIFYNIYNLVDIIVYIFAIIILSKRQEFLGSYVINAMKIFFVIEALYSLFMFIYKIINFY